MDFFGYEMCVLIYAGVVSNPDLVRLYSLNEVFSKQLVIAVRAVRDASNLACAVFLPDGELDTRVPFTGFLNYVF